MTYSLQLHAIADDMTENAINEYFNVSDTEWSRLADQIRAVAKVIEVVETKDEEDRKRICGSNLDIE